MCMPFKKKSDVEVASGQITVRRRFSPRKDEYVLELVKRRPTYTEITFWVCTCGSRMHTDILVCTDCGRHRHHSHCSLPVEPEEDKCGKAFEELKKELDGLCKEVKELKGSKEKKPERQPEPTQPPPPPKTTPVLPQLPFIPLVPAPYLPEPPKPSPQPEQPPPPEPQPPVVINNIIPECPPRNKERSRRRRRDPSPASTCSEVSAGSFQRVRRHVNVLGRRLWHLEDREALRDEVERQDAMDELRLRRKADERRRLIEAEERARHRAMDMERDELAIRERREREKEREAEWELDRERRDLERREERERGRERASWRRREWEPSPVREFSLHYHMPRRFGWMGRGFGPYVERWEGERRLVD